MYVPPPDCVTLLVLREEVGEEPAMREEYF